MNQPLDELEHLRDVLRGPRVAVGPLDAEVVELPEEGVDVRADVLLQAPTALRHLLHDAVIDVGEVHHVLDLELPIA